MNTQAKGGCMPQLKRDAIILDMKAATKEAALRELAGLAATQCGRFTEEVLYKILLERETVGSTGVGNGVAIPHPRQPMPYASAEPFICVARLTRGIGFDSPYALAVPALGLSYEHAHNLYLHIAVLLGLVGLGGWLLLQGWAVLWAWRARSSVQGPVR